jgi:hypothetical protein
VFGITGNHNVTIDASCTSGTAFVTGFSILIVDPAATMTVVENIHPTSIWDQPITNHLDSGSTGEALSNASSGGDANAIARAVWDLDANPSAIVPGSFGDALLNVEATATVDYDAVATAVWDALMETGMTAKQGIRLLTSVNAGKTSIDGTTVVFRDVNDTVDRITATMDGSERINVTLNL